MKQFSHSKLQVYERCPLQYKLKYLTKLKEEGETTIEAFMGSRVHDVMELLYRDLLKTKLNSLEDLWKFYDEIWRVEWNDEIVINDKKYQKKHYFDLGKKCIRNYYEKYHPFDHDQTLGIEHKINLKWGEIEIVGYVDRLAREGKGVYSIHDYKTGTMMDQIYADQDRQLALYSIAVKQKFKEAKKIKLIWHFVTYGEDVISERSDQELKDLKDNILEIISEINEAEERDHFLARETKCDWCGFWEHCPKKKHMFKVAKLPKNKYLKDSGIKLANEYVELAEKKSEINKTARTQSVLIQEEIQQVKEAILRYAKKHSVEALQGSEMQVAINQKRGYAFPTKSSDTEKYEALENLLISTKYWKKISSVNATKLGQMLEDDAIETELKRKIIELASLEEDISLSIRKK